MGVSQRGDHSRPMQFTQRQCGFLYGKGGRGNCSPGRMAAFRAISMIAERCGLMVWVFSRALTCSVGLPTIQRRLCLSDFRFRSYDHQLANLLAFLALSTLPASEKGAYLSRFCSQVVPEFSAGNDRPHWKLVLHNPRNGKPVVRITTKDRTFAHD